MKYAIIESGGKQYRAVEGDSLEVDRLSADLGASLKLERVLLLADGDQVVVGTPFIQDNPVWAKVVEHFKGPKVIHFKYSPKKRIRVKAGHRQSYTRLLIQQIGGKELRVVEEAVETEAGGEKKAAEPPAKKAAVAETASKAAVKAEKTSAPKASATGAKVPKAAPAAKKSEAGSGEKKTEQKPAAAKKSPSKSKSTAAEGKSK